MAAGMRLLGAGLFSSAPRPEFYFFMFLSSKYQSL
jgi:hypothetical protein